MRKPSRLHRRLSPTGTPLFEVSIGSLSYNDHNVHKISTQRGNGAAAPTLSPATATVDVPGRPTVPRHAPVRVRLTSAAATRFASGTGITAANIRDRFTGRRGNVTINDVSWKRNGVSVSDTSITASSWTAVQRIGGYQGFHPEGTRTALVVYAALNDTEINDQQPVVYSTLARFDTIYEEEFQISFDNAITKYGTDMGTMIQHMRSGGLHIWPIGARRERLMSRVSTDYPILRSHTISPATWTTGAENQNKEVRGIYWDPTDSPLTEWVPPIEGGNPVMMQTEMVDFTHVRRHGSDDTFHMVTRARNYQINSSRMRLESISFDMIRLLASTNPYDRRVAAQVLRLEEGDPVYLGGDWQTTIAGSYFANAIEETITPDEWQLKLTLNHPSEVVGIAPSQLPAIPARVWDQATYPWNTQPGTWHQPVTPP